MTLQNNNGSCWWEMMTNYNELTMVFVTISVAILLAIVCYKIIFCSSSPSPSPSLPPGPRSLPIVGYLPFLRPNELYKQFTTMSQTYGPIFKFYVGTKVHIVINDLDLVKEVVRDKDETFSNHKVTVAAAIITYGGQDVGFSNNSYWRDLRKIFVHEVLSNTNLEACSHLRRDEVRKTIKTVYSKMGTAVDIGQVSFATVMNVITSIIKGDISSDKGETDMVELKIVAEKIFEFIGKPNISDIFPSLAWFDIQGIERGMKKQLKKLDQIFTTMIDERIKSNSKNLNNGIRHDGKKDFLQVLIDLKNKKQINGTQMKGLMLDIMIGATESTTTLLEWAMTEIIKNHEVMERVQEELAQVVGVDNIVEEFHLLKLEYLDATIKETFRYHSIAPFLIPRSPNKDCIIGGYTIPKDCSLFINAWAIHRDPRYWNNPLDFNPERFLNLDGNVKLGLNGNNLKFLPFGSGRRVCPGITLANKMDMYILASLLHSFNWSLPYGDKLDLSAKLGSSLKKQKPLMVIPAQKLSSASLYM